MQRLKDDFLNILQPVVDLSGCSVLEVGAGEGAKSVKIAERCRYLTALEPDSGAIDVARRDNPRENIKYVQGSAEHLPFGSAQYDVVFFTLSLHHVSVALMGIALDEAARVVKLDGRIVLLEPAFFGSYFEAEKLFGIGDGDERPQKIAAYSAMLSHPSLREITELFDETIFQFDSLQDFVDSQVPTRGDSQDHERFLQGNKYQLNAFRRMNVFRVEKVTL